jgi:hypothetical protein
MWLRSSPTHPVVPHMILEFTFPSLPSRLKQAFVNTVSDSWCYSTSRSGRNPIFAISHFLGRLKSCTWQLSPHLSTSQGLLVFWGLCVYMHELFYSYSLFPLIISSDFPYILLHTPTLVAWTWSFTRNAPTSKVIKFTLLILWPQLSSPPIPSTLSLPQLRPLIHWPSALS